MGGSFDPDPLNGLELLEVLGTALEMFFCHLSDIYYHGIYKHETKRTAWLIAKAFKLRYKR